jgi:hypothetical protein
MISRTVPLSFIMPRHELTRGEFLIGLAEGWLDPHDVFVNSNLPELEYVKSEDLPYPIDLIRLIKNAQNVDLQSNEEKRLSWLRILLGWIFQNRENLDDPLLFVEQLYSGFNYPDEIYSLVRFNVPNDGYRPQDHSAERNRARLMKKWKEYCNKHLYGEI